MRKSVFAAIVCLLICCPAPAQATEASGDLLYDRFSELALAEARLVHLTASPLPDYNPAVLPAETLVKLEAEFAADARYWELRAWSVTARASLAAYGTSDGSDDPGQLELLRRARDCGNASPAALYRLALLESRQRRLLLDPLTEAPEGISAESRAKLIVMNREDEQQLAADLDAIITAHPDEAWPYYCKADYWFDLGAHEQAAELLEQGNAAARCSFPALYPESFIRQRVWTGQPYGDNMLAGGILAQCDILFGTAMRWKEHGKDIVVGLSLGEGSRTANAFQRFACRVGSSDGLILGDSLVLLVLTNMVGGAVLSGMSEELSQEQILVLLRARDKHSSARTAMARYSGAVEAMNGALPYEIGAAEDTLASGRGKMFPALLTVLRMSAYGLLPRKQYEGLADEVRMQQQLIREKIRPVMAELALVDYSSLAWPEAWGQPD